MSPSLASVVQPGKIWHIIPIWNPQYQLLFAKSQKGPEESVSCSEGLRLDQWTGGADRGCSLSPAWSAVWWTLAPTHFEKSPSNPFNLSIKSSGALSIIPQLADIMQYVTMTTCIFFVHLFLYWMYWRCTFMNCNNHSFNHSYFLKCVYVSIQTSNTAPSPLHHHPECERKKKWFGLVCTHYQQIRINPVRATLALQSGHNGFCHFKWMKLH